jgi:hypothetical protein
MTRKTWVHHPITGKMVPKEDFRPPGPNAPVVHGDLESFVSPVDGSVISDRSHLRAHNSRHGVTNVADYGPEWFERRGKEKYQEQQGKTPEQRRERREAINRTMREKGV